MSVWQFDTGADLALGTQLALGYQALLEPLRLTDVSVPGPRGPYFKTIHQIPCLPDSRWLENDRGFPFLRDFPNAAVYIGDASALDERASEIDWEFQVSVVVGSDHAGHAVAGRLNDSTSGNAGDPGVFVMMQHATELLQAADVPGDSLCAGSVHVTGWRHHVTTNAFTLWRIDTTVRAIQAIDPDRALALIDRIEVNQGTDGKGPISSQEKVYP